jgi:hypothetical protein
VTPPSAHYELRSQPEIVADGFTGVPLLLIATNADGTPMHVDVVLNTSRAGAGQYTEALVSLGELGGTSMFVPCSSETAGCLGDLTLTMALASDPGTPVAHVDVQLLPPAVVGSAAECLDGGNRMHLEGNDRVYTGVITVADATWSAEGDDDQVVVNLVPTDDTQGTHYSLRFETRQLGQPLAPGVYGMAQRAVLAPDGAPGMDVNSAANICATLHGRFQVHDFAENFDEVTEVTITFEQYCEDDPDVLSGCVHYER